MARRRRGRGRARPQAVLDVDVVGLAETLDALRALPPKMQRTVFRDGLRASAQVVLNEEQRTVPVGEDRPGRPSGTLRRSLTAFRVRLGKNRIRVFVGATAEGFYGRFVEYGTRFFAAKPWLRPALHAAFSPAVSAFRNTVRAGIDREVRATARESGSV